MYKLQKVAESCVRCTTHVCMRCHSLLIQKCTASVCMQAAERQQTRIEGVPMGGQEARHPSSVMTKTQVAHYHISQLLRLWIRLLYTTQ